MSKNQVKEADKADEQSEEVDLEQILADEQAAHAETEQALEEKANELEAAKKRIAELEAAPKVAGEVAAPKGTGIFDPNPVKSKIAREKSKKKQVIALERGYYGDRLREEGDVFEAPVDEKADWFEDYKGNKGGNPDEELV